MMMYEPMPYGSVMVVDDMETNLYIAKGLLKPYNLSIDTATSGFETIEKIKAGKVYDIIFMDHLMPKMNGIEAAKIIRELGYVHPIVALTANTMTDQLEFFLANGFDGFISKPIDVQQLDASLNKLIRDKQPPEVIEAARNGSLSNSAVAAAEDNAELREKLLSFQAACMARNKETAKNILIELKKKRVSDPVKNILNTLVEHLLQNNFEEAAIMADQLLRGIQ
jgi:CheY-like chemotaxis protein